MQSPLIDFLRDLNSSFNNTFKLLFFYAAQPISAEHLKNLYNHTSKYLIQPKLFDKIAGLMPIIKLRHNDLVPGSSTGPR